MKRQAALNWKKITYVLGIGCILVVYLFPLYWLFVNSLKSNVEMFRYPPTFWPKNVVWENYINIFGAGGAASDIKPAFLTSLIIATETVVLSMIISLPAAYGLAQFKVRFTRLFLLIFMIGQMLSPTVKLVPLFMMFRSMNLLNTNASVVLSLCTYTVPFNILIMRPYFMSVPISIHESALIDGCNKFTSFLRVILPISYPGVVVAAVFNFLSGWGDLVYSLTYITDQTKRPIIGNMYTFIGEYGTQWNMLLTFAFVAVFPVIIMFFFMQKYIINGITMGSVKG